MAPENLSGLDGNVAIPRRFNEAGAHGPGKRDPSRRVASSALVLQ